mmetsp:Transcript_40999/g.101174  ORF Transcript_40999/g.101174 Transcript_40999/m.101174 type:complete len:346 (-) Transcript_40999:1252-2289(-)
MSGRLVAAITESCWRESSPSISVRSWLTTRSDEPPLLSPAAPRLGQSASSSSKKTMHGGEAAARMKSWRTARSDSPTNLERSSGPLTLMKQAPLSLATALASSVLPQPGGPYSSTPALVESPRFAKRFGWRSGSSRQAVSSARSSLSAPTSAQVTFGTVEKPSRRAEGCTLPRPAQKSFSEMDKCASCAAGSGLGSAASRVLASIRTRSSALSTTSVGPPAAAPGPPVAAPGATGPPGAAPSEGASGVSFARRCVKMRLTAITAASLASAARSAPTKPAQASPIVSKASSSLMRMCLQSTRRIRARAAASGVRTAISRSKRPARRSAGSSASGRLVAAITRTGAI